MPVSEGNGTTIELWHTIPYHLQPNNTTNISMVLYIHSKIKITEKEEEKRKTRKREKKEIKETKEKKETKINEANMHSRRRPSPEGKAAVCWYDEWYVCPDQHRDATRRPRGRQEEKKRVETKS